MSMALSLWELQSDLSLKDAANITERESHNAS